jgi:hypothetical protein
VDKELTNGSINLIESGAVYDKTRNIEQVVDSPSTDEIVFTNDAESEEYAAVNSEGVRAKALKYKNGEVYKDVQTEIDNISESIDDINEKVEDINSKACDDEDEISITNNSETEEIVNISNSGVKAKSLKYKKGNTFKDVSEEIDKIEESVETLEKNIDDQAEGDANEIVFTNDSETEDVVSINNNGIKAKEYFDKDGNKLLTGASWMKGLNLFTICSSQGSHGQWQTKLMELTGCVFDQSINFNKLNPISMGGTTSLPYEDDGSQARAINLVNLDMKKDIIMIQNTNDRNLTYMAGSINDIPFMRSQAIYISVPGTLPASVSEASEYFNNNFQSIVGNITPQLGTIIKVPWQSSGDVRYGATIKFTGTATTDGVILITVGGLTQGITVTTDMSIQDIVDGVINYNWQEGFTDIDNGDGSVSIVFGTPTSIGISFDANGTGVTATVTDCGASGAMSVCFWSLDTADWTDSTKWRTPSLYAIYKGMVEYLIENCPEAKIFWWFPYYYLLADDSTYKRADGSFDIVAFNASQAQTNYRTLREIQKNVAQLYSLEFLDMTETAGMTLANFTTYFNFNDSHPKQAGYERYAETIQRILGA